MIKIAVRLFSAIAREAVLSSPSWFAARGPNGVASHSSSTHALPNMAESAGRRPSVSSQPVSRPSTPRIDVAAVLAAAQRNRERCRAVVGEARAYR
eukprot:COSAG01_NODE_6794_length_3495_cov_14.180212_1_plen_95_part_10